MRIQQQQDETNSHVNSSGAAVVVSDQQNLQPQDVLEQNKPDGEQQWMDEARQTVNKLVIEAEQNRALLEAPRGNELNRYSDLVADEFFHISCHVDPGLRQKIEAGQFVELEKLLTKDHPSNRTSDGRLGLFTKDGLTYFAPASGRETRI